MELNESDARRAVEVAWPRNCPWTPVELAEGVLTIANANMERAIRVISVEKGYDPREFTLLSFGGAGGMHCAELARLLSMPRVLIPQNPGLLSAVGMLLADVVKDNSRTVMLDASDLVPRATGRPCSGRWRPRGWPKLRAEGVRDENVLFERLLDMRYKGQSFEIIVPHGPRPGREFSSNCTRSITATATPDKPVEVVNLRLRSRGHQEKPTFPSRPEGSAEPPPKGALLATRTAIFNRTVSGHRYPRPCPSWNPATSSPARPSSRNTAPPSWFRPPPRPAWTPAPTSSWNWNHDPAAIHSRPLSFFLDHPEAMG